MHQEEMYRQALRLEYFTVGYNILEALASIFFGSAAGSIALIGFGLDSIIESLSGLILIWRLRQHKPENAGNEAKIERKAIRFVGITFLILAVYVLYESLQNTFLRKSLSPPCRV